MSDNHEESRIAEDEAFKSVDEQENQTLEAADAVNVTDAVSSVDSANEDVAAAANQEQRVARSVSNKPLISDEQVREHAEGIGAAPAVQIKPTARRGVPRARRMNLSVTHLNPWSVAKVSFMMGVAGAIIQIVAVASVWALLNIVGVFDQITQIVASTGLDAGGLNLADVFSLSTVLSGATIFSIIEVVLFTVLVTVVTLIYNVVSALVGGIHVTLGDD